MECSRISFKERIKVIDGNTFEKVKNGVCIDVAKAYQVAKTEALRKFVSQKMGEAIETKPRLDILKADEFYTEGVRTCTAGGISDSKTGEAAGFHIYDCFEYFEGIDDIIKSILSLVPNADRALIIGGKRLMSSVYSIPIIDKIIEGLGSKIRNITVFKEHLSKGAESDIHYSSKDKTWNIHTVYNDYPLLIDHDVNSEETLIKNFKEIKLADGDTLYF